MKTTFLFWLLFQEGPSGAPFVAVFLAAFLLIYVFTAFCFQRIAERTDTAPAWWAWVPILNVLLILKVAEKPLWWIILLLIPFVNFVIAILLMVKICQRRGKSGWLAVGLMIPVVNFAVIGYLAFAE